MKLNKEQKAIWAATYAATFAQLRLEDYKNIRNTTEFAIDIANESVRELENRRTTGRPDAGKRID